MQPAQHLNNRSFVYFVATQFLGAFNDNVFKQLILLMAITTTATDRQGLAMILFAVPFLLFSGHAGQLSEKFAKTKVMRAAKIGELLIMGLALIGFGLGSLTFLFIVLFLMGTQSAYFGPSKYGVLPELIADKKLVAANGIVQMTTFGAIILGGALGGGLLEWFDNMLVVAGLSCVVIAVAGIFTVWRIDPSRANKPDMQMSLNSLGRVWGSLKHMTQDRPLLIMLAASGYFWFAGGVAMQTVNNYGVTLLELGPAKTSLMMAILAIGIMLGSVTAALVARKLGSRRAIFMGGVGTALVHMVTYYYQVPLPVVYAYMLLTGFFSGLYYVPIFTFLQARPPLGEKGEVLAAVNWVSYVGITTSGAVWWLLQSLEVPANHVWMGLGLTLALLLVFFMPKIRFLDEIADS